MATITDILHFATTNSQFTRKELIAYMEKQKQTVSPNALSIQLNRLLESNGLVRLERGVYCMPATSQRNFIPFNSDEIRQLNLQLKEQFPFANYCVWSSKTLTSYMHHIPNLNYIYIDVERDVTESVFNYLKDNSNIRVFICPDSENFNRYINGSESIIVRTLISEAPLHMLEGFKIPTIEKILVDIVGDVEFEFIQGAEISDFYKNIIGQHSINNRKLMRYASRRGRRQQVDNLINNVL